jgi:hypothetical protein
MTTQDRMFDAPAEHPAEAQRPITPSTLLDVIANKDQRFFLRTYLRSNIEADQETARARCAQYHIDYAAAYRAVRDGSIE